MCGSFNTVRTAIFQVAHILLKPGELKTHKNYNIMSSKCYLTRKLANDQS